MSTSSIGVSEGTDKKVATHSFSEDSETKHVERVAFGTGVLSLPSSAQISEVTEETLHPIKENTPGSSTLTSNFNNFNAANCVDNSTSSKGWDTNGDSVNDYLQIDLGSGNDRDFVKCRLYLSAANYDGEFKIQYSDDGSSWTDVVTGWTPDQSGWNEISWGWVGEHRYWRIVLTSTSSSVHGDFMEMDWYDIDSAISVVGLGKVSIKSLFSQASQSAQIKIVYYDNNDKIIGESISQALTASDKPESNKYVGTHVVFDNTQIGASSIRIDLLQAPSSGNISFLVAGI